MAKILINIPYLEGKDLNPDGSLKPHVGKGKPVVMMVQGDFCPHCTTAKPAFQDFAKLAQNVVAVTVQTDGGEGDRQAGQLLSKHTAGVPTFLGFDSQGKFIKAHQGDRDAKSLQNFAMSL